jgi:hypothetical protein
MRHFVEKMLYKQGGKGRFVGMESIKGLNKTYKISNSDCFWAMLTRLGSRNILNDDDIKNYHGVYVFWNWQNKPIRIGKAVKLRNRILRYYTDLRSQTLMDSMESEIALISVIYTNNEYESTIIELDLIAKHKPIFNYRSLHNASINT